ncbi:hypothetical protein BCR33DRAFT_734559 [Rhizoclosmatium globosum]|uniref:Uncharacterized protein n=1 Tax=Rhizoclosmatium globosum TaxID=329046 RepID=A0A1Y2CSD9_9FUNG|nr:hypothetical protein BCR33DRAFT_734559 [Rhizoclosmatium globosum]|eukprot:ORY49774.1 hypothetical protein BCR33DRAFT_734559 [Rhizoclosmatium globosum]
MSDSESESSLDSIGSVEANETDDSEGEQSHLAPQLSLRESMLAVVRVGAAPAENVGDLISVTHKQPDAFCGIRVHLMFSNSERSSVVQWKLFWTRFVQSQRASSIC